MTTAELSSRFDLICDKVGSPYFSATEKADFFNTAQLSIIDEIIFPTKKQDRKDVDIFDFSREDAFQQGIGTLVRTVTVAGVGAGTREIAFSVINTSLGSGSTSLYKVIDFLVQDATGSTTNYNSAKRVRTINAASRVYGNLRTFNSFTNNTGRSAIYTISSFATGTTGTTSQGKIEFFPAAPVSGSSYLVEVVVFPRTISISPVVNPEIDPMFHNELLFRSLQLAGISIREKELYDGTNIEQAKEQ
jgi:hypothetical protein